MDYFTIVNLTAEPFSNSPDPAFFFQSRQHRGVLQKLELALRLRRGLNVVIGEVGTGKTTLCRQLIRRFSDDPQFETHLILDPAFESPGEFLGALHGLLHGGQQLEQAADPRQLKERIKQILFHRAIEEDKTVVLIIDEGQKLAGFCLELLRECLNYETNTFKLLQIVIFAQQEFEALLHTRPNFTDRINLFLRLGPLGFGDTCRLVRFRLAQASQMGPSPARSLFTLGALWAIYRASSGYPRRIIHLCHQCLLAMIIQDRHRVGWSLARGCAGRFIRPRQSQKWRWPLAASMAAILVLTGSGFLFDPPASWWPVPIGNWFQAAPLDGVNKQPSVISQPIVHTRPMPAAETPDLPETFDETPHQASGAGKVHLTTLSINDHRPEPPQTAMAPAVLPQSLGAVTVAPQEMLSWLMVKIYGHYSTGLLKKLFEANAHLGNPDRVPAGTVLQFPARQVEPAKTGKPLWWICLGQTSRLEEAVAMLRGYPSQAPPARIVGHWNQILGLRFSIVLWRASRSETKARERIAQLPSALSSTAVVLAGWDTDTVFFADPYTGGSD